MRNIILLLSIIPTIILSQSKKNSIIGEYISSKESFCNPEVIISIKSTLTAKYNYTIYKNCKKISNGKLQINENENQKIFVMKNIAGIFRNDSIIIENYGNSMNNYLNFKNCGTKYLYFVKIKKKK